MGNLDIWMLRLGALYLLVALISEIFLADLMVGALPNIHSHLYVLGFSLHSVFGLAYRQWPELKETRFARIHALLFVIGAPILMIGFLFPRAPDMNIAMLFGSFSVLLGCLAFTLNLFSIRQEQSGL